MALSAILSAEVYANAVSSTPGPVSVSEHEIVIHLVQVWICLAERLTMPFNRHLKFRTSIEQVMEIVIVQLCSE